MYSKSWQIYSLAAQRLKHWLLLGCTWRQEPAVAAPWERVLEVIITQLPTLPDHKENQIALLAEIPVSGASLLCPERGLSFLLACLLQLALGGVHNLLFWTVIAAPAALPSHRNIPAPVLYRFKTWTHQLLVDAHTLISSPFYHAVITDLEGEQEHTAYSDNRGGWGNQRKSRM